MPDELRSSREPASTPVVPSTSGVSVLDVLHATEEIVGRDVFERARKQLPAQLQEELASITAVTWVPNTVLTEVLREAARAAGMDTEDLAAKAIRGATARTFSTVWRALLRFTTDEALIKRAPLIYARSRNCGKLSARIVSPGVAEVLLTEYPSPTPPEIRSLGVGIQCVLEFAGRQDVQVSSERKPDGGRFVFRWRR